MLNQNTRTTISPTSLISLKRLKSSESTIITSVTYCPLLHLTLSLKALLVLNLDITISLDECT